MVAVKSWFVVAVALCACVRSSPAKLYSPDVHASPQQVATLYGDVRDVDGKFVSEHGGAFELLEGCHIVGVVDRWGVLNDYGGVTARLPRIVYALPMRGAHRYIVKVEGVAAGGPDVDLTVTAREEDASGTVTRTFEPSHPAVETCPE